MNAAKGTPIFYGFIWKTIKKMYLTLHHCPFMTLQRQMNVTGSMLHRFHNLTIHYSVGGYDIYVVLLFVYCVSRYHINSSEATPPPGIHASAGVTHLIEPDHNVKYMSSYYVVIIVQKLFVFLQLATSEVDMAVGGDQGGAVRLPASWCGVVGLKPTQGLVPYTGAMPVEMTVDHLGPMARNVTDCARLLEVGLSIEFLNYKVGPETEPPACVAAKIID